MLDADGRSCIGKDRSNYIRLFGDFICPDLS